MPTQKTKIFRAEMKDVGRLFRWLDMDGGKNSSSGNHSSPSGLEVPGAKALAVLGGLSCLVLVVAAVILPRARAGSRQVQVVLIQSGGAFLIALVCFATRPPAQFASLLVFWCPIGNHILSIRVLQPCVLPLDAFVCFSWAIPFLSWHLVQVFWSWAVSNAVKAGFDAGVITFALVMVASVNGLWCGSDASARRARFLAAASLLVCVNYVRSVLIPLSRLSIPLCALGGIWYPDSQQEQTPWFRSDLTMWFAVK
jgi:hypothetical protein